ncbi:MAG: hypothetical protein CVV52_10615 [Spirochaetae bacterium HGW-Spirochaetae-8]|nr:MAG: hypothetical protein CVV52_10615 [Spirochaetae bacterium HGW-Spirochaetae-8]
MVDKRGMDILMERYNRQYPKRFWDNLQATYDSWWEGTLGRPIIHIMNPPVIVKCDREILPYQFFWNDYPQGTAALDMLAAMVNRMNQAACLGDGFPHQHPAFGAGVLAAIQGARSVSVSDTIWFIPEHRVGLDELRFGFKPDNPTFLLMEEIYRLTAKWVEPGAFQLGMTDLGGIGDVLSAFRPGEELLLDFYDEPELVKRRIAELHNAWHAVFEHYNQLLDHYRVGYTCWTPMLSSKSYYMLQCDLAYMLGPAIFNEFILPELTQSCARLARPFYHLDGQGQLIHLDTLLAIPNLQGIQWIPGEGNKPLDAWPEVFRKISEAGKKIQFFFNPDDDPYLLDKIADQIGRADNICAVSNRAFTDLKAAEALVNRF